MALVATSDTASVGKETARRGSGHRGGFVPAMAFFSTRVFMLLVLLAIEVEARVSA